MTLLFRCMLIFKKTSYFRFEPLPTFSIEEKKIHFFRELWPFWQIFPPSFSFLLKKVIFSSSIFTFYRRPLSIWFLQPLWDGRWSSTKQYEKKKSLENMLALLYYSSYIWWSFKVVWSFSFSSFIFLSLASTTIKLVLVVISMFKENYLMLKETT